MRLYLIDYAQNAHKKKCLEKHKHNSVESQIIIKKFYF